MKKGLARVRFEPGLLDSKSSVYSNRPSLISISNDGECFSRQNEPPKSLHTAPHFCQIEKNHCLLWAFILLRKDKNCSVFSTFSETLKGPLQVLF